MRMLSTQPISIPSSSDVLHDLDSLLNVLFGVMDSAVQQANDFFESRKEAVNRYLHPGLVRYHAIGLLRQHGHEAKEESDEPDLEQLPLANNGIALSFRSYDLRVLKAFANQSPPAPGYSRRKQAFYGQQLRLGLSLTDETDEAPVASLNLLVLWVVDSNFRLRELILTCPKSGGVTRDSVAVHWSVPVPSPIERLTSPDHLIPQAHDLPYRLPTAGSKQNPSAG